MYPANLQAKRRTHRGLHHLDCVLQDLLARDYDAETIILLLKIEAETLFPGLKEHDQEQVVGMVVENARGRKPYRPEPPVSLGDNVIQFPNPATSRRGLG